MYGARPDPGADAAAPAVLEAFEKVRGEGRFSVECYRPGVAAWRKAHPDHAAEYAAKMAVAVILANKVNFEIKE